MSLTNFTIASWNVNSVKARLEYFLHWLKNSKHDVITLQEIKCQEENFPFEEISEMGYNIAISGQKTFNGVAILSKFPIEEIQKKFPDDPDPQQARFIECLIAIETQIYRVISVYVPNGQDLISDKFIYKTNFFKSFSRYCQNLLKYDEQIVICGDYNIALADIDVYDPNGLENSICYSQTERNLLKQFLNNGYNDAYRLVHPNKSEYTWWDYRGGAWQHNKGLRIDHILLSPEATDKMKNCYIDFEPRKQKKTSDHAPIIVEFDL